LVEWLVWLQFLLLTVAIVFSGARLSRYGDVLAEKTGLGRTWLGLVVLAAVTSLPELATGVSAIRWVQAPDITVGDLLGSCVFNLLILAVVDVLYRSGPALSAADRGHLLAAAFGVMMLGIAGLGLMAPSPLEALPLVHFSLGSLVLLACYLVAMRLVFRYQRREMAAYLREQTEAAPRLYDQVRWREAAVKFAANALVVVAAGVFLPKVANSLAGVMGWQQSMVATIFVAASTSLPELVVTVGALRLGAIDLAVGNLFGSNLINLAILGVMDLLYFQGPLLRAVSPHHSGTVLMAMVMTGIAAAELVYRPRRKSLKLISAGAFSLVFLYAAHIFLQLLMG
jgi:cation:H+ antiporter